MGSVTWGADVPGGIPFSGNVTLSGCRLVGAGAADDALALHWNAYTGGIARWSYNANTNEDINGYTPTVNGSPTITDGWISHYAALDGNDGLRYSPTALTDHVATSTSWSFACWFRKTRTTFAGVVELRATGSLTNFWAAGVGLRVLGADSSSKASVAMFSGAFESFIVEEAGSDFNDGNWHSVLCSYNHATGALSLYVDGNTTPVTATYSLSAWSSLGYQFVGRRGFNSSPAYLTGGVDDIIWWDRVADPVTDWITTRYPATGSGTLTGTGLATKVPSAVSWTATAGAEYGAISKVELLDASLGWTQVGGDNPTSPISVSGITLAADQCLRVTLTPKADAIRSETPTLADVTLTYADAVTGRPWLPTVLSSGRYA